MTTREIRKKLKELGQAKLEYLEAKNTARQNPGSAAAFNQANTAADKMSKLQNELADIGISMIKGMI